MKKRETPVTQLLDALHAALEEGTAELDVDRTFAVTTSIEEQRETYEITGLFPRLFVNDECISLPLKDRFELFRFRRQTIRRNALDNRAYLAEIAHHITTATDAHRQQSTSSPADD